MPRHHAVTNPLGRTLQSSGFTAVELARRSGVGARTITEYLAGRKEMLDHHLTAFARALDCDPEDLVAN